MESGDKIKVKRGIRKGETGVLVRFEWVNGLGKDMWLVDFDNNRTDGYIDETNTNKSIKRVRKQVWLRPDCCNCKG